MPFSKSNDWLEQESHRCPLEIRLKQSKNRFQHCSFETISQMLLEGLSRLSIMSCLHLKPRDNPTFSHIFGGSKRHVFYDWNRNELPSQTTPLSDGILGAKQRAQPAEGRRRRQGRRFGDPTVLWVNGSSRRQRHRWRSPDGRWSGPALGGVGGAGLKKGRGGKQRGGPTIPAGPDRPRSRHGRKWVKPLGGKGRKGCSRKIVGVAIAVLRLFHRRQGKKGRNVHVFLPRFYVRIFVFRPPPTRSFLLKGPVSRRGP
jgi:hypothetical protein